MILLDMDMPKSCKDCDLLNVVGNCSVTWKDVTNEADDEVIAESCPIKAEIPKNTTNGEVIRALFPNEELYDQCNASTYYGMMRADTEWWNAPWKE